LILALTFIAFFALVLGAVLNFGDVTGTQHGFTEATASNDAIAEGGAAYAAADAGRTDLFLTCNPGNTGQLTMQGGDKVTYIVKNCNSGNTASIGGAGTNCLLCILNQTPIPPATSTTAATVVLTANRGIITTGGDDWINGSIASGTSLMANPVASTGIYALSGASTAGCVCNPSPVKSYTPPIVDPLASLGAPSPVAGRPNVCTPSCVPCPGANWSATNGCTMSFMSTTATIGPGLWASLSVSGNPSTNVTLTAGTYVFTGLFNAAGNGTLNATAGTTIYLTCPGYGPSGQACASSGGAGGYLTTAGNGSVSVSAPSSGQYKGIAMLADPHLFDPLPGGVGTCIDGSGNCLYTASGNGASISGTVDLRSGGVAIHGNGNQTINSGRMIANSLFIGVSPGATSGLNLNGSGTGITASACGVFDETVNGKRGTTTVAGRAVVQSECGSGSTSGVVDFNYGP
jgi:hypothetical protein